MKILYATDGEDPALAAGEAIERFLDPERVEITVLAVTPTGMPVPDSMPYMLDDLAERRDNTLKLVDQTAQRLRAQGFVVTGRTAEGQPAREIVRLVDDEWFDMTVMGGASRSWLGSRLLGSVSTHVLHHSPSSVLVVHEAPTSPDLPSVLVGVDGSRMADRAVHEVSGFLVSGATVKTLAVAVPPAAALSFGPVPLVDPPGKQAEQRKTVDHAWQLAEEAASTLREAGYKALADVNVGHATQLLLEEADRGGYDLIAVGSRGLTPLRRTVVGSVSDNIVRHAPAAFVARRSFD